MTRVLQVFGTMNVGGAELRTLDLFRELAPHGVKFDFLTLSGNEGALDEEIQSMGGVVHPIKLDRNFPARYLRLLHVSKPDVIDSHVATFSGALLFGAWLGGVPRRIAHFRSDGDGHMNGLRRRMQRAVMITLIGICATDIIGVSPSALTDGYRSDWRTDRRARVIVNGIGPFVQDSRATDLREHLGVGKDSVILMHVGRPSLEKNRIQTVRVLGALRDRGIDAHLALVGGTGSDSDCLHSESRQRKVDDYVHELGVRRDARVLMSQADLVLLTSIREGLPGVVLEALSTGTPVVAAALPGVEFIAARCSGVTSIGLNEPLVAWVTAVLSLLDTSDTVLRYGIRRAFESSEFSLLSATRSHHDLYCGVGA